MPFLIDDRKLIPAPIISITRNVSFTNDGTPINTNYTIGMNGVLLPGKGSPSSLDWYTGAEYPPDENFTSDNERFASIINKQRLLRAALAATGYKISYSSPTYPPVEFYPKLVSINFEQGPWVVKCNYTASLEAPLLITDSLTDEPSFAENSLNLSSISDDYTIRERDENSSILEISRTVSAAANYSYSSASGLDLEPWERAKSWVRSRLAGVPFTSGLISIASGINLGTHQAYNLIEDESFDRYGGRYSVSQRLIFHNQSYIETRQINRSIEPNLLGNLGPDIQRISLNGQILGLDANNDPSGKFTAANNYWASISGGLAAYVGASGRANTTTVNEDRTNGIINYTINYINQVNSTYTHVYDVTYTISNNSPSVTIAGLIEGVTVDNFATTGSTFVKFDNAVAGWGVLEPSLRDLAFAHSSVIASGSLYSIAPVQQTVGFNKANGTINYNYVFPYNPSGSASTFFHEYSVEYNTENALADNGATARAGLITSASINGVITGLSSGLAPSPALKVTNAKNAWAAIDDSLLTLVKSHYSIIGGTTPVLSSGAVRKTVGLNTTQGIITYSCSFANTPPTSDSRVAVEDVTVEDSNRNDVFAIQSIPGRLSGPIIQNIGTFGERRRSVNISLTMYPQLVDPFTYAYTDRSIPAGIASGIFSGIISDLGIRGTGWFLAGDSENWNYKAGFFTKSASVVY